MNIKTTKAQRTNLNETAKGLRKIDRDSLKHVTGGGGIEAGFNAGFNASFEAARSDSNNGAILRGVDDAGGSI